MCDKVGHNQDCECLEAIDLDIEENEYEEECYDEYEEEEDDGASENRVASDTWNLPTELPLAREAADFYLLLDLYLDGLDDGKFDSCVTKLSLWFSRYADMVVGGELRYTYGHVGDIEGSVHPKLIQALRQSQHASRHEAWDGWYGVRREHGTDALHWAEEAFEAFGRPATYGGHKWAYIAEVVRKYLTSEYTPLLFVDMCWSLEHNGGQFFGKLWNTYKLQSTLDANKHWQEGETTPEELTRLASPEIREFYAEVR
jgi:hypothetical protein